MRFEWGGKVYTTHVWSPERGVIGDLIALDTETALIEDAKIPDFVIGQAYAGRGVVYFLHLEHLAEFLDVHRDQIFIMHNAAFDAAVLARETGFDFDEMIRSQRLWDVGILYRLLDLARNGEVPRKYNLGLMSEKILGIALDKSMEVRGGFGKYIDGIDVNYSAMTDAELKYAATDAIVTFRLYKKLIRQVKELSPGKYLTHKIQLMGEIALAVVSRNGFCVDLAERDAFLKDQEKKIVEAKRRLAVFGYVPGRPGVQKTMIELLKRFDVRVPLTAKSGLPSTKAEHLESYRKQVPFVDAYLTFKSEEKLKSFLIKLDRPRIHCRFNGIMTTGRTSSESPNLQNLPKDPRVRRLFSAPPGKLLAIGDYKQLELCTLSQVCLDRFGTSKMADLINDGVDLHRRFASKITGKREDQVTKGERNCAKACNFGFPGGLGVRAFVDYADKSYGVKLSEFQAESLKRQWLDTFPEMRRYLEDSVIERHDFSSLEWCENPEIAVAIFKRIARGETFNTKGEPYSPKTIEWALTTVLGDLAPDYMGAASGSDEIFRAALQENVVTRTGRIRAKTDYCAARNTPFQGLASDGAKIALYRLIRAEFHVVNFVHDEAVVEIDDDKSTKSAESEIAKIMVDGMTAVVPDVRIQVETFITKTWEKSS